MAATTAATQAAVSGKVCAPSNVARVATDASFQPFESVNDKTKAIEGFDVDLLNAITKSQGISANYTNENFDTIFAKLAQGDYDLVISSATITAERQKTVDFSNPYFVSSQAIVIRKDDNSKYKAIGDLEGLKIGVQKGTTGEEFAGTKIKNGKLSSFTLAPQALQALANKDVDAVIIDTPVALNIIAAQPTLNLIVIKGDLTVEPLGIAVRKDCGDLLNKINAGLRAVVADGTYNTIYRKYFGEDAPASFMSGAAASGTKAATAAATMAATSATTKVAATMAATMAATASK